MLEYQWQEVLVPCWQRKAAQARELGIRLALEPHPGFAVYNPETLLKLRGLASDTVGANLDPSHLFWQGIDPVEAARVLGDAGALYHVHAKDTAVVERNRAVHGVLDTTSYGAIDRRSWLFRTCGYGHGDEFWKPFVSMLRTKGYDHVLSIEHEDSLMSLPEGYRKAVEYLRRVVICEPAGQAWWF
jgi:sugar phosphate isomerase/epimerase